MSQTLTQHKYRANFILDTRNYDQPVETLIENISKSLGELEAEVLRVINDGRKEFIRVTDKKHTGDIYLVFDVNAPSNFNAEIQEKFRLDRTVKRIMVQNLD